MKEHFKSYYRPDPAVFKNLWDKCTFVLDTSVLLDLYRYSKETREELFQLLENISSRIWIPHHVALEYQQNRANVIEDVKKLPVKAEEAFEEATKVLNKYLGELGLNKPHSRIDIGPTMESIDAAAKNLREQLEEVIRDDNIEYDSDQIRDRLDKILENCIGDPESEDELKKWYGDGESRYKHKIPPGFEDRDKEKSGDQHDVVGDNLFQFNGRTYKRKFGDLVIWQQIVKKFHEKDDSHMIFVTSGSKEDWWRRIHGNTIGPRPELIEEISGNPESFYIYHIDRFLYYSREYLDAKISEESISQAREVSAFKTIKIPRHHLLGEAGKRSVFIREDYVEALENFRRGKGRDQCIQEAIGYFLSLTPDERYREATAQGVRVSWPADGEPAYLMQLEIVSLPDVLEEALALTNPYIEPTKTLNAAIRLWLERIAGVKGLKR